MSNITSDSAVAAIQAALKPLLSQGYTSVSGMVTVVFADQTSRTKVRVATISMDRFGKFTPVINPQSSVIPPTQAPAAPAEPEAPKAA